MIWNLLGFSICTWLPGAGVTSVAELVTTVCGFSLWSFLGLLTLPTLSRDAALQIDWTLRKQGAESELIESTARQQDLMQDGEPDRPALIETIFHPVPSVNSRVHERPRYFMGSWNVARNSLFVSWACLGLLSRAVHSNVGRPELWAMPPVD